MTTTSSTRVVKTRELVDQESIQFIRPQTLTLTLIDARPNTRLFVFFGGVDVTHRCFPSSTSWQSGVRVQAGTYVRHNGVYYNVVTTGTLGATAPTHVTGVSSNGTASLLVAPLVDVISDSIGQAVIEFNIPSNTFRTGNVDVIVTDAPDLALLQTQGSVFGGAKAVFSANGTLEIFQSREVSITTITRVVPVNPDPLAQSFFTHGVKGGIFVTSIDVYFQTKDASLPVQCELRTMVNGYPSPTAASSTETVSVLAPEHVNTSLNASVPSKFSFYPPVYLPEDSDFCFVLRSNSNKYNVFTSRMGEASIEDGRKIHDNPFIGSVFKSENNVTWTAEQFEDVKFTINKAVFDTRSAGKLVLAAEMPALSANGSQFRTVQGSNKIQYRHAHQHGLEVGSSIHLVTRSDDAYANASFNGISHIDFGGTHTITSVPDRYTVEFELDRTATQTGPITTSGVVSNIDVDAGGTNYKSTDTIVFTGGGGSGAAATPIVVDGVIKNIIITNGGSGYTSPPSVTVQSLTGVGAQLVSSVDAMITVFVNKPMTSVIPQMNVANFGSSTTKSYLRTTIGNYEGGNLVSYTSGKTLEIVPNQPIVNINQNSLVASRFNENGVMNGTKSAVVEINLQSNNPNVSPIIDFRKPPELRVYSHTINNQRGETIDAVSGTGTVASINVTSGGSGYTQTPTVRISAPDLPSGVQATAVAQVQNMVVTRIDVVNPGTGYTRTPHIELVRATGDTSGTGATAQARLSAFNTELLPSGGNALARYITKITKLQIVSTGVRLFSTISSVPGSSVDWYIRTSMSGANHEQQPWALLSCNVERNKSSYDGEFFEYEFQLDDIAPFDTYDLKCVMTASNPVNSPVIKTYRLIVIA